MPLRSLHVVTLHIVMAAALLAAAAALGGAQDRVELPVFGTEVEVVAVPVFVADKAGKAIPGLTAADFEVEDEGKKVSIVAFSAVDAGATALPADAGPGVSAAARRQLVILFDFTFSTPGGVTKAKEAALELARDGLAPNDLAAVAVVNPTGPQIVVGFTSDHSQVSRAIQSLGSAPEGQVRLRDPLGLAYELGVNVAEEAEGINVTGERDARVGDHLREQLLAIGRADQNIYRQRVLGYVDNLGGLAELLNSIQGRKQVILLSAGFDQGVLGGAEGQAAIESRENVARGNLWEVQSDSHFGDASASAGLGGLFRTLRGTDTVLHTIDVAGIAADTDAASLGRASGGKGKETLAQLALGSGGRFIRETNDLAAAMREILDATRYYYVLAFEPSSSKRKAGDLRRLKVKVARSGTDVSHRTAYVLPDPKAPTAGPAAQLRAAEVIGKGISGGALRLSAVAVPYRSAKGVVSLPVVLEIDGESLMQGADAKKPLTLEIYAYALDGKGRIQDALSLTPKLDMAQVGGRVREKGVQVLTAFRVAAGTADLRFLVRSPESGRAGSLRTTLDVPAFSADRLYVSSPLVMDDPRGRLVLPTPSRGNRELEIPFRLENTPFTPEGRPRLKNGEAREICLMTWKGPSYAVDAMPEVAAELLIEGRAPVALEAGSTRVVNDADGFRRLVLGLTPRGVQPGDYRLHVTVRDLKGGGEGESQLAVRVQ